MEGIWIEPQDVCGSVEDATLSLWLTSVDDWTYLLITHNNTLGFSFGFGLVASESTTVVTKANQISILPGQGQVIQLHLAHRHRIISISLPQLRHLIIIVSSTINKITTHSHPSKKKKISSSKAKPQRSFAIYHVKRKRKRKHHHQNKKKSQRRFAIVKRKVLSLVNQSEKRQNVKSIYM